MKAEIKDFDCTDHDPISSYTPEAPLEFDLWITFHIGPQGGTSSEYFRGHFIAESYRHSQPVNSRFFVLDRYGLEEMIEKVQTLVSQAESETWNQIATKLNIHLYCEFENYQSFG